MKLVVSSIDVSQVERGGFTLDIYNFAGEGQDGLVSESGFDLLGDDIIVIGVIGVEFVVERTGVFRGLPGLLEE